MKRLALLATLSLASMFMVVGAPTGASVSAAPAPAKVYYFKGLITSITSNGFTMRAFSGRTPRVVLNNNTRYLTDGHNMIHKPAFYLNRWVRVVGTYVDEKTVLARVVSVRDRDNQIVQESGSIVRLTSTGFQLRSQTGKVWVINFTSTTNFFIDGKAATPRPTFHAFQVVQVQGFQTDDETIRATRVSTSDHRFDLVKIDGPITEVVPDGFWMQRDNNTRVHIIVNANTKFYVNAQLAARPTFREKEFVLVQATWLSGPDFTATVVRVPQS